MLVKIFQVSSAQEMGKKSKFVEFSTQKHFKIRACVISAWKAKHLDSTQLHALMQTKTEVQTHLLANRSERARTIF